MLATIRRFLVFQAFLWWQGGFVFYAAVVVPVGTDLQGAFLQGLITQQVTDYLALIGLGWHLLFAWDLLAERDPLRFRRRFRGGAWLVSLLLLGILALVHLQLDALLEAEDRDELAFRRWHIVYLWGVTVQWLLALGQAWATIRVWSQSRELTTPGVAS